MKLCSSKNNTCISTCLFLHLLFLDDHNFIYNHPPDLKLVYLLIGQDFNMSPRCDQLGSLLPRWASEYGINLIILFFLDQVARVGQWTTRLPYLKIRTSRYGMPRSLVPSEGGAGAHIHMYLIYIYIYIIYIYIYTYIISQG